MQKIKPDELNNFIGKRVHATQLDDIYDTYIILTDIRLVQDQLGLCDFEGVIDTISRKPVTLTKDNSTLVYNDSFEEDSFCGYE